MIFEKFELSFKFHEKNTLMTNGKPFSVDFYNEGLTSVYLENHISIPNISMLLKCLLNFRIKLYTELAPSQNRGVVRISIRMLSERGWKIKKLFSLETDISTILLNFPLSPIKLDVKFPLGHCVQYNKRFILQL